GSIIASGWHTCSMIMRVMVDGFLKESSSMGSPGVDEIRWIKPVRGGDTLSISTTVLDVKASGSRPDRGVVWTEWRATNQHGELVATVKGMGMFGRRPAYEDFGSVMRVIESLSQLKELIGQEVSVSNWVEITQERVNQFAEATGDLQW